MRKHDAGIIWGSAFLFAGTISMILYLILFFSFTDKPFIMILYSGIVFVVLMVITLIVYYTVTYVKEKKIQEAMLSTNFSQIDELTPFEFEEWVARLMRLKGYKAYATKASGDYGVDVIAEKYGNKIGIQVKKYHKAVGIKAIQEVVCGLSYYGCNEGWVVTTAPYFTTAAKETAKLHGIRLIAHDDLVLLFHEAQKSNKK